MNAVDITDAPNQIIGKGKGQLAGSLVVETSPSDKWTVQLWSLVQKLGSLAAKRPKHETETILSQIQ